MPPVLAQWVWLLCHLIPSLHQSSFPPHFTQSSAHIQKALRLLSLQVILRNDAKHSFQNLWKPSYCMLLYVCVWWCNATVCMCVMMYATVRMCVMMYATVCMCVMMYATVHMCVMMYATVCMCVMTYVNVRMCVMMYVTVRMCVMMYALWTLQQIISKIRALPGNRRCADCGSADPEWLSVNLGILICIHCSGRHRELSVQYSRIRSLTLDQLKTHELLVRGHISHTSTL